MSIQFAIIREIDISIQLIYKKCGIVLQYIGKKKDDVLDKSDF